MAQLINGDDVGVPQAAGGSRFGIEPLQMMGIFPEAGGQRLQRYDAINERVARLVDDSHGALSEPGNNLEFAEFFHRPLGAATVSNFPLRTGGPGIARLPAIVPKKA